MAQGMTYKDFEARMAAARAAHLKNIDITGKKIQGIYTQAARDLAKRAEATRAGTLTERWVKDYQKALEKRIEQLRGELGGTILSGMRKSAGLPGDTVEGWLNDALAMVGVDGSFTGTFFPHAGRGAADVDRRADVSRRKKPVAPNMEPHRPAARQH